MAREIPVGLANKYTLYATLFLMILLTVLLYLKKVVDIITPAILNKIIILLRIKNSTKSQRSFLLKKIVNFGQWKNIALQVDSEILFSLQFYVDDTLQLVCYKVSREWEIFMKQQIPTVRVGLEISGTPDLNLDCCV